MLYSSERFQLVDNINPYLIEAPDIFVDSNKKPICDVTEMIYGNKPTDGGFLFLTSDEKEEAIKKEPNISKYIRKIYGLVEYINNKERYCLWLVGVSPAELRKSNLITDRIEKVKNFD